MCEQRLSKEEVNKYKRAFAIFDDTGDGTITSEVILCHLYRLLRIGGKNCRSKNFLVWTNVSNTLQKLSKVMTSLGGCPPWAVLQDMIDAADSDRNGKVSIQGL